MRIVTPLKKFYYDTYGLMNYFIASVVKGKYGIDFSKSNLNSICSIRDYLIQT